MAGPDISASLDWGVSLADPLDIKVYLVPSNEAYAVSADQTVSLGWNPYETSRLKAALAAFESVCNVRFEFTDNRSAADFVLGTDTFRVDFHGAMNPPEEPNPGAGVFARSGAGWDEDGAGGLERGGQGFATLLHELGHGMGLAHPHDDGGVSIVMEGVTELHALGVFNLNQGVNTVMSYNDGWRTAPQGFSGSALYGVQGSLMALDIAVLQAKYGANSNFAKASDLYRLPSQNGGGAYYSCIWDAAGVDSIVHDGAASAVIDLRPATIDYAETGGGPVSYVSGIHGGFTIARGVVIEDAVGGSGADVITGNAASNRLCGRGGDDRLDGGGGGVDVAIYSGASDHYDWKRADDGAWRVTDLRQGAPDGQDVLLNVEMLHFSDRTVSLSSQVSQKLATALRSALFDGAREMATGILERAALGGVDMATAMADILRAADATTTVATLSHQFFVGVIPSRGGYDFYVAPSGPNPTNLDSDYYQAFNLENRYINFAVDLGVRGAGKESFAASYGGIDLNAAAGKAYETIFGARPNETKITALMSGSIEVGGQALTRAEYFALLAGDGPEGIATKAAMVGWLLAEAAKSDVGVYSRASNAFLEDLFDGQVDSYQVDLIGVYGRPEWSFSA